MRYKIGDVVRIKRRVPNGVFRYDCMFLDRMTKFSERWGKIKEICEVKTIQKCLLDIDGGENMWSGDMFSLRAVNLR